MLKKRLLALGMASVIALSMMGCSKDGGTKTNNVETEKPVATDEGAEVDAEKPKYEDTLTIDFFCKPANYQGIQGGWFGKYIKDKFNIEVNIIAPNIAGGGETLYQTRSASGNLGDLIVVQKSQLKDCIDAGIVMDITDRVAGSTYLPAYETSINGFKEYLGVDKVYGVPTRSSLSSPLKPNSMGTSPSTGDFMRVDYYKEIGSPELKTDDDLLNALKAMQEKHPTAENGANVYGFSIFKDWDGIYMKYPITMCSNNGFNPGQEGTNFILMNWDASETQNIDQDGGVYYNQLKLLYKANQMGLVDPDSSSMTWDMLTEKTRNGEVLWSMWPWASLSQYNTADLSDEGKGFAHIPVASHQILADGMNPFGTDGSVMAMGSQCKDPDRVFEFMDWIASPEYMELRYTGIKGVYWDVIDGKCDFTEVGKAIRNDPDNALAPEEIGGGNYTDGSCQFNTSIGMDTDINPNTGESFSADFWESVVVAGRRQLEEDWTGIFKSSDPMTHLVDNKLIDVAPGSDFSVPADSSDIATKRSMCGEAITNASWNMVFAKDDADFEAIWKDMKDTIAGYGYAEVLEADKVNVAGFKAARAKTLATVK